MKLVLDVGPGTEEDGVSNPLLWVTGSFEVETLDANPDNYPDYLGRIEGDLPESLVGRYDVVHCSHVLEHVSWRLVGKALDNLAKLLKTGGELVLIVPSLEWASDRILHGELSMAVLGVLYGGQKNEWDSHKMGFNKPLLEALLKEHGFSLKGFEKGSHYISVVDGVREEVGQHAIKAVKV